MIVSEKHSAIQGNCIIFCKNECKLQALFNFSLSAQACACGMVVEPHKIYKSASAFAGPQGLYDSLLYALITARGNELCLTVTW